MAGWLTNGMQPVGPISANGSVVNYSQITNNGSAISGGTPAPVTQVPSASLIPVDLPASSVQNQPLTAAASAFQIGCHVAGLISNTGSSTAGAATLNTKSGLVTTESLTTAAGSTYTFTLTNSLITASSPVPQIQMIDATNTAGQIQVNSITNGAGSVVAVFQNVGTAALNGKMLFCFHV